MSEQEIIEGNKLIAEFMDIKLNSRWDDAIDYVSKYVYDFNDEYYDGSTPLNFGFHESYDWLMPVVEKITTKDNYSVNIHYGTGATDSFAWCTFHTGNAQITSDDINTDEQSLVTAIWKSVIDFIKWYNKHIKK